MESAGPEAQIPWGRKVAAFVDRTGGAYAGQTGRGDVVDAAGRMGGACVGQMAQWAVVESAQEDGGPQMERVDAHQIGAHLEVQREDAQTDSFQPAHADLNENTIS